MYGKKVSLPATFMLSSVAFVVAGGLLSAINSAASFDRGSWLVAYLVLVGGVAQAALAWGRQALGAAQPRPAESTALITLWAFGSMAVPLGVLAEVGLAIGLGSLALVIGLWLFARGIRSGTASVPSTAATTDETDHELQRPSPWLIAGYIGLVAILAISVAIGCVLADAPLLGTI